MNTIRLREPYMTRSIRFLEVWETHGWRVKVYGIRYRGELPDRQVVDVAKQLAGRLLPIPAVADERYGVGWIIAHQACDANWFLVDWWTSENALIHQLYMSPLEQPDQLTHASSTGLTACVWELRVVGFERQAWIDTVLANPDGPDLPAYLACQLNEDA